MIILSIDLGDRRTGLAMCDKAESLAYPLEVIEEVDRQKLAEKIKQKVIEKNCELIVLGLPKNMDGTLGSSAKKSIEFKNLLETMVTVPIVFWDERRTTVSASFYLNETNIRGKKRKSIIDTLSASIILENFLNYRKNSSN